MLALAMVLSMSAVAFAADDATSVLDGTTGAPGVVKTFDGDPKKHQNVGTTLNIPKGITVYGSLDKVYGPTVTYTYSIAPVTIDNTDAAKLTTVTDFNGVKVAVKSGITNGVTLTDSTAVFTSSEVTLASNKYEVKDNITASVDLSKFTAPGIYRYVIKDETAVATLYDAGITRDLTNYKTDRYLDVYIHYNSSSALEVYGYVLTEANHINNGTDNSIVGTANDPLAWDNPTSKSSGYVAASETVATDEYHTIDVKVTKKVTGTMGDKTNEFPFTIAVSDLSLHYYSGESATAPTAVSQLTDGAATSLNGTLKDGDIFYIYGLNPKATVAYTESNNTPDTYILSVTDAADAEVNDNAATPAALTNVQIGALIGTKTTATLAVSDYDTTNSKTSGSETLSAWTAYAANDNGTITFTNNLEEISPTGVALRVAPYVAILCAGIVLLVVSRKRRAEEE